VTDVAPRKLSKAQRLALAGKPVRVKALAQAKLYVGVKEHPAGSNRGAHIDRWERWANGITGYPWCAAFVCGMVREVSGLIVPEPRRASVGFLEQWAAGIGELLKPATLPRPGDLVCYRFDSDDWPDHIGFVDKALAATWRGSYFYGSIRAIEGNTSAEDDANGGEVEVRYRSGVRMRFIRLDAKKLRAA
jgi:CHAP domain-containing protein